MKSVLRIRGKISELMDESYVKMANPELAAKRRLSLIDTLQNVSNMIHSWAKQYAFCNDKNVFNALDEFVDQKIRSYLIGYARRRSKLKMPQDRRHLLGVKLASSSDVEKSIAYRYHK